MSLEPRNGNAGPSAVKLTACPFCHAPIHDQDSFTYHWPYCDENPNRREGDRPYNQGDGE